MLRKMKVNELINQLSAYPEDFDVIVIADNADDALPGFDVGMRIEESIVIIHAGEEQKEALG